MEISGRQKNSLVVKLKLSVNLVYKLFELKNSWGCCPPHSNYLGVFCRFRRTFAEVFTFGEAIAYEFQPNCRCSKSAIFLSRNINYTNSLLWLCVGMHIIYIYIADERYIPEVEMKTI